MGIAIAIAAIILLGGLALFVITRRGGDGAGRLSRETRASDKSAAATTVAADAVPGTDVEALETADARARAEETRSSTRGGVPVARDAGTVAEWEPLDPEELSISRRMFFNRAILTLGGVGVLLPFGASLLAFLWPSGAGGFGGKVSASFAAAQKTWIDTKAPFYVPAARTYLQPYPTDAPTLAAASKIYDASIYAGMEKGIVALYQKCVHLGCRVPWCGSAQWFECPCHGSKYNRVGEKRDGPAPRGLDRFEVTITGDNVSINTSTVVLGPVIGTDTTKQAAEGPHCV